MSSGRFHIVVLEDNEPDLVLIKRSIREAGLDCEITAFSDGAEAMQYVNGSASRVPDLMILDFNVPRVEGASVLRGVRASTRWSQVGVFMFTASQDPGEIAKVRTLGADNCLAKPMDLAGFAKIGRTVKEWLEGKAATA